MTVSRVHSVNGHGPPAEAAEVPSVPSRGGRRALLVPAVLVVAAFVALRLRQRGITE